VVIIDLPSKGVKKLDGTLQEHFYIDGRLDRSLDKIVRRVKTKDEDTFIAVDGSEGGGKSVLAFQLAKKCDPSFDLSRVVFTPKRFQEVILAARKGEAVVFDEAFRGLSSRGALSEVNKLLVGLMMECRQKNLIVIVVMPTFFLLDKYVALWRASFLIHVYRKGGKRGFWMLFNSKKKKLLYLKGKATYSYSWPKTGFRGRFYNQYTIDEKAYRKKKKLALEATNRSTRAENFMEQRNTLLWLVNREWGLSTHEISKRLKPYGVSLAYNSIAEAVVKRERELKIKGFIE